MKIVYITGMSASGKTTMARNLAEKFNIPVLSLDILHFDYLRFIEQIDAHQMVNEIWKGYFSQHKKRFLELYSIFDILIIEGENLIMKQETEFINSIFEPEKTITLILQSDKHKEWFLNKWGYGDIENNIELFTKNYESSGYHKNALVLKDYDKAEEIINNFIRRDNDV